MHDTTPADWQPIWQGIPNFKSIPDEYLSRIHGDGMKVEKSELTLVATIHCN